MWLELVCKVCAQLALLLLFYKDSCSEVVLEPSLFSLFLIRFYRWLVRKWSEILDNYSWLVRQWREIHDNYSWLVRKGAKS